jgi:hypothetical protein
LGQLAVAAKVWNRRSGVIVLEGLTFRNLALPSFCFYKSYSNGFPNISVATLSGLLLEIVLNCKALKVIGSVWNDYEVLLGQKEYPEWVQDIQDGCAHIKDLDYFQDEATNQVMKLKYDWDFETLDYFRNAAMYLYEDMGIEQEREAYEKMLRSTHLLAPRVCGLDGNWVKCEEAKETDQTSDTE